MSSSVRGGLILLIAESAIFLLRRRLSAAVRHQIRLVALFGLLGMPVLSLALPGWSVLPTSSVFFSAVTADQRAIQHPDLSADESGEGRTKPGQVTRATPPPTATSQNLESAAGRTSPPDVQHFELEPALASVNHSQNSKSMPAAAATRAP
ncbi:MAG: hypothetical protein KDA85_07445, partial [Planctomycetaceae bacterium]|nr:hypothetical protein [Planctomycetaceae bacterium]